MNDCLTIPEAARLLDCRERHIYRLLAKGVLISVKKEGQKLIDRNSDQRLARAKTEQNFIDSQELRDIPAGKREEAIRRLGIIQTFEKFAAVLGTPNGEMSRQGCKRAEALSRFAASRDGVTRRSLKRWISQFRNGGLPGLVDKRGGKLITEIISPEALELFKSMYLTQQQLSVKLCWQNINYASRSEDRGWKIPSLQSMYRFIERQIPLAVQVLHREGLAAYEAKCAPYIQTDPDSVQPGQVWIGDHSTFNCWIRHRGRWVRPWITAWQDMRSRMLLGWHISASPNQTTILLAMRRALEQYGPPDLAKIDNGKDYDSEMFTGTTKAKRRVLKAGYIDEQMVAGIYAMMDIGVSFAIKYHPQGKGAVERLFATIDSQLTATIETYCGKDVIRRPDDMAKLLEDPKVIRGALDIDQFRQLFARYADVYNNSAHTGQGMEGRTPAEVLATRTSRRVLAEGVLDLLMRVWSGELKVGKNGVRFKNIWYGQYDTELLMRQGKKVRVAYDPDDLRQVYVYDAATLKLITIAEQNRLIAYGDPVSEDDLRQAMHQKSRATRLIRQFRDSQLTANMDLTDLTIRAMEEGRQDASPPDVRPAAQTLRPVRTPLDGQVREHKRREAIKAVKKAAGAEATKEVLDIDFSVLTRRGESEPLDIDLSLLKQGSIYDDLDLWADE